MVNPKFTYYLTDIDLMTSKVSSNNENTFLTTTQTKQTGMKGSEMQNVLQTHDFINWKIPQPRIKTQFHLNK